MNLNYVLKDLWGFSVRSAVCKENRRKIVHIRRYSRVQCGRFGVHNPGGVQIFFFSEMFTSFLESTRPIVRMGTGCPSQGNKAAEA